MVDIRPPLGRYLSIRGGWQLAQLRFQESEVDGLGEEIGSAKFISAAPAIGVAIGAHHHDREIGEPLFDLAQQLQAVHARHVDVRQDDCHARLDPASQQSQRLLARGGEMDYVSALAGLAAKALAEQLGDIGLVVDDQDADTHAALRRDCFAALAMTGLPSSLSGLPLVPIVVIPGWPEGLGPETMNTGRCPGFAGPCSWVPGSRAAPAPRNDGILVLLHALLRRDGERWQSIFFHDFARPARWRSPEIEALMPRPLSSPDHSAAGGSRIR